MWATEVLAQWQEQQQAAQAQGTLNKVGDLAIYFFTSPVTAVKMVLYPVKHNTINHSLSYIDAFTF